MQAVVKGVVTVFGIEADFDIVLVGSIALQNRSDFLAEVALHFEHETTDPLVTVGGLVSKNLFRIRVEASTCLAAAYRAKDGDTGEQAAFGDGEPMGRLRRLRHSRL